MKTLLLTLGLMISTQALAETQTIVCKGGGVSTVHYLDVIPEAKAKSFGTEISGLWTRPSGGPVSDGSVTMGTDLWNPSNHGLVTKLHSSDRMAQYQVQLQDNVIGVAFKNMKAVLVVTIQDASYNDASSGYDLVCSSTVK